jgi:uncharacterized protein YndB with AHSA1/START domain
VGLRYEATIIVAATSALVWKVLTDLPAYQEWNPYIVEAEGVVEVGEVASLTISPPDSNAFSIDTEVTVVSTCQQLSLAWISDDPDRFGGGADFVISTTDAGTQLTCRQTIDGEPTVQKRGLGDRNDLALEMMLVALKARAERLGAQ